MNSRIRLAIALGVVAMLLLTAVCGARGVGNIIAQKVVAMTPYDVPPVKSQDDEAQKSPDDAYDVLVYNRNLFNQKSVQDEAEPEPEPISDDDALVEEIAVDGSRPVLTDLRVSLKGTQVASDPAYSLALIMPLDDGADARMQYLGEGGMIWGEGRIVRIVRNRIYMVRTTQGDRLEYLDTRTTEEELAEAKKAFEKAAESQKVAEKAAEKAAEKGKEKTGGGTELVKKIGTDSYEVSREVVDAIRKNPNSLKNNAQFGKMPKVQPVYKGGNIGGFRLLGVDSNSVYAQLGLKSGDTIIDVNGQTIDGPQTAMALLDALKPDQNVGLKINRAGQEKTLTFSFK